MIINFDEDTLQRLDAAIRHWLENAAGNFEGVGSKHCALCERFIQWGYMEPGGPFVQSTKDCVGCPVHTCTGLPYCWNTPYQQAYNAYVDDGPHSGEFQKAAAQMHDLLVNIRGAHGMEFVEDPSAHYKPPTPSDP